MQRWANCCARRRVACRAAVFSRSANNRPVLYLIKSGGENIYPIEIERVLMADARVAAAVVVRRRDAAWGEVPVAFVAVHDHAITVDERRRVCRAGLASYKAPQEIRIVVSQNEFPRNTPGQVQRGQVERWLD